MENKLIVLFFRLGAILLFPSKYGNEETVFDLLFKKKPKNPI